MKKMITTTVAIAALFVTSAQAEFSFGEMFKDMKEAALTLTKDSQETSAKVSADTQTTEDTSKKS